MSRVQPRAAVISPSETNANVESEKKPTASKQSGCHWPCRWRAKRVLFLLGLAQAFMTISICACVVVFEQFCLLGACDSESWLHLLLLAPCFLAVIFVGFVLFHECRKGLEDGQPFDGVVDEPEEVFLMVTIGEVASLEAQLVELSKRCEEAERRLQQKAAMRAGEDEKRDSLCAQRKEYERRGHKMDGAPAEGMSAVPAGSLARLLLTYARLVEGCLLYTSPSPRDS